MKTHSVCRAGDGMSSGDFADLQVALNQLAKVTQRLVANGSLCPRPCDDGAAELCEIETRRGTFTVLLAPGCTTWTSDSDALPPIRWTLDKDDAK